MQFRTSTIFVIVTTLAVVLGLSTRAHFGWRLLLAVSVAMTWLGFGLASSSLRKLDQKQHSGYVGLCLLGLAIATGALALSIVLGGVVLEQNFPSPT